MFAATQALSAPPATLTPGRFITPSDDLRLAPGGEKKASAHAHLLTAQLLEESGRPREALGHYLAFMESGDADSGVVAHIADLVLAYRDLDAALEILESFTKTHPDSPQPYVDLTRFALNHQDERESLAAKASAVAGEMLRRFPRDAASYENAVSLHLALGRRNDAIKSLDAALKQKITDARFWLRTGRTAQDVWPIADADLRTAHVQKINTFFNKARDLALASKDADAALAAADYFLFSNQLPVAAEICDRVVKQNGSLSARARLVRLYEAMEKPAEAQRALEDLVRAFPNDVEGRRLLAGRYLQKRDVENAVVQLEAVLRAGGGELQDYLQLGNLLRFGKDPEKFLVFTRRMARLFPGDPRASYFGALAHSRLKQYAEAVKLFDETAEQAGARAPELLDDMFHFNRGVALERSGRLEDAARQFEKSIQLTPSDDPSRAAGTLNYLGYMWLERGEHLDQAEQFIRKANELEPGNAAYQDSLGWVFFKQGKYQEALKELLRAESLTREFTPEDAEILDHIAQTYDRLGTRAKAEGYWKRVLDLRPDNQILVKRAEQELRIKPTPPPDDETKEKPAGK